MNVTADLLMQIAPTAKRSLVEQLAGYMDNALEAYGINTPKRVKYFLGQAAHESDHFKTLTEYASGKDYEGRKDLGNTKPGYGVKYKGRGIFQITGYANYLKYGEKLSVDLVNNPELAASPEIAVLTACEFWQDHGLNELADRDDIKGITKRINGGFNGLSERIALTEKAGKCADQICSA